jgi:FHA domain
MDEIAVDTLLLGLKIAFLVLLYLFIWRIVRSASRDLRLPQESFIQPGAAPAPRAPAAGRLVVLKSPTLPHGWEVEVDSAAITVGRGSHNQIELRGDDFASATHARIEPRQDGVWLEDAGSTNGTFVNGARIDRPRKLTSGDVVRVGETDLRYDR